MKDYQEDMLPAFRSAEEINNELLNIKSENGLNLNQSVFDDKNTSPFVNKYDISDFFTYSEEEKKIKIYEDVVESLISQENALTGSVYALAISLVSIILMPIVGMLNPLLAVVALAIILGYSIIFFIRVISFIAHSTQTELLLKKISEKSNSNSNSNSNSKNKMSENLIFLSGINIATFFIFPPLFLLSGSFTNDAIKRKARNIFEKEKLPLLDKCINFFKKK